MKAHVTIKRVRTYFAAFTDCIHWGASGHAPYDLDSAPAIIFKASSHIEGSADITSVEVLRTAALSLTLLRDIDIELLGPK